MKKIIFLSFILLSFNYLFAQHAEINFDVEVKNERNYEVIIRFLKGDIWESSEHNVQNIVLIEDRIVVLNPQETRTISLTGFCANHHRGYPGGEVNITPLRLNASIRDQINHPDDVWLKIGW